MPLLEPADIALVHTALADMAGGMVGAPERVINKMITKLALVYPNGKLSDPESEVRMDTYIVALSDIPGDILSGAMDRMIRTQKFFPAIAEIRAAAAPALAARIGKINGLKALVLKHDLEWREPVADQVTPEQAATIRAEAGLGVMDAGGRAAAPRTAAPTPTIEAYRALGLTDQEAAQAVADHERMMRRGARPVGVTASAVLDDASNGDVRAAA